MKIPFGCFRCPNCARGFYANASGQYCPECWSAWCKADGSFELRFVDYYAILKKEMLKEND